MARRPSDPDPTSTVPVEDWPNLSLPEGFDMDLFLVEQDLRELGKWEGVPDDAIEASRRRLDELGLVSRVVRGPSPGVAVVFFARSASVLDRAESAELEYRATRSFAARAPSSRVLGAMLGYPACCVEKWATGPQDDEGSLARLEATLVRPAAALLDFFPRHVAPAGFVPCELECENARRHAERVADAMWRRHGVSRAALESALRGVVFWISGPLFLLFQGVSDLDAAGFRFESIVTPVESPRFPDVPEIRDRVALLRDVASVLRQAGRVVVGEGVRRASGANDFLVPADVLARHLIVFGP